jgi:SAM-dependent methyltransferase
MDGILTNSATVMANYRWNTSDFAVGYDASAAHVHPHYLAIQDAILSLLPQAENSNGLVVDLGGGSGRLIKRILDRWPNLMGVVVDQSEPFLALAERRLARFGPRAICVQARLQDDWPAELPPAANQPTALVSMSAIHHLEPAEKRKVYQRCHDVLALGGVLLNGDEVRPGDDAPYLAQLSAWADHMRRVMAAGVIPPAFHAALEAWIERNVSRFGEPKKSGDDCHETIEAQLGYFRAAGFQTADCPWRQTMWAVLRGVKSL